MFFNANLQQLTAWLSIKNDMQTLNKNGSVPLATFQNRISDECIDKQQTVIKLIVIKN